MFIGEKGEKPGGLLVCESCIWLSDGEGYGQGKGKGWLGIGVRVSKL